MATQKFKTEWLEQIALLAKCGTADDVVSLCDAIARALDGDYEGDLSPIVHLVFNPIAKSLKDIEATSKRNAANAKQPLSDRQTTAERPLSESERPLSEEKEEGREEEGEAERESDKENVPHTPLKEKDKEKGEEGEEEKEEEREISCSPAVDGVETCVIEADTLPSVIAQAIPAPLFVPEADPNRLTDRMLEEEFDALWLLYPRKSGKKDALRHYKAARKSGVAYDTIEDGIKRYAQHIRDEHTEEQYIAMGSTWFCGHRWEDKYARHGPKPGSMEWLAEIARGERQV